MKELKINVPEGYEIDKNKSTYEIIVFKEKNELPKSWDELGLIDGFKTIEQAEAVHALAKLSHLRHVYRQGWEPDWDYGEVKYCIIFNGNNPIVYARTYDNNFLAFKDDKTAELFLKNFRDLIEQAKPLIS